MSPERHQSPYQTDTEFVDPMDYLYASGAALTDFRARTDINGPVPLDLAFSPSLLVPEGVSRDAALSLMEHFCPDRIRRHIGQDFADARRRTRKTPDKAKPFSVDDTGERVYFDANELSLSNLAPVRTVQRLATLRWLARTFSVKHDQLATEWQADFELDDDMTTVVQQMLRRHGEDWRYYNGHRDATLKRRKRLNALDDELKHLYGLEKPLVLTSNNQASPSEALLSKLGLPSAKDVVQAEQDRFGPYLPVPALLDERFDPLPWYERITDAPPHLLQQRVNALEVVIEFMSKVGRVVPLHEIGKRRAAFANELESHQTRLFQMQASPSDITEAEWRRRSMRLKLGLPDGIHPLKSAPASPNAKAPPGDISSPKVTPTRTTSGPSERLRPDPRDVIMAAEVIPLRPGGRRHSREKPAEASK